ncbi:glycosyltransferase family A protein [Sphingobacterium athyrii]|nr:glycosyltransferase family A protein [Sphingobacterium athyrii]
MNRSDDSFLKNMNVGDDYVVVNQIATDCLVNYQRDSSIFVSLNEKGLSRSRNKAIQCASGDIGVIADDDLTYVSNYQEIINKAYAENQDADIIIFKANSFGSNVRKLHDFGKNSRRLSFFDILKVSSVLITFRVQSIKDNNIYFDERFGSGSGSFSSGEENIFLKDCLDKGLKVYYYPAIILNIDLSESSWFKGFNKDYFISKGALFNILFNNFSMFYSLIFLLKNYKKFGSELTFGQKIKCMVEGKRKVNK